MRFWAALLALAVLAMPESASAQTRRAFIAAVGDYRALTDLQKTLGDASGYAEVFRDNLRFQVTQAPANATRAQFNAAFGKFLESIRPGDEVAFIFSGHGWSDGVENYLALSDAPRDGSEYELKTETVALTSGVLAQIHARKPRLVLAIVDACRDYPFDSGAKAGFDKGLVRIEVTSGTLVVYAAGQRQKALDRLSNNDHAQYSLFTRVLLPKLRDPARPLMTSVDEARDEVERLASTVNHQQRPAFYSDISLGFCFAGACRDDTLVDAAMKRWAEINSDDATCADYESFRRAFPTGIYATRAETLLSRPPCVVLPVAIQATTGAAPLPHANYVDARSAPATMRAPVISGSLNLLPDFSLFRECEVCPEMIALPRARVVFPAGAEGAGSETNFRIAVGRFELTWDEWSECVQHDACHQPGPVAADQGWGRGRHPVVNVTWQDTADYSRFLSARTGGLYRPPSNSEWEWFVKSGTKTAYPWGDEEPVCDPKSERGANFSYCRDNRTHEVGTYPSNGWGLFDVIGNVSEWVDEQCRETDDGLQTCVYRGAAWTTRPGDQYMTVIATRDSRDNDVGFRVVRSLE